MKREDESFVGDGGLLITVIIPVFNVAQYLRRCVDSVLIQSYKDFELILVDDGSTDGSGDMCDEFAKSDSRVHVIHQPNAGVSAARNRGIEAACAEYLSFVDADDWVEPTFLHAFAEEVKKHPNVDCVVQGFYNHEGQGITYPEAFYNTAEELCSHLFELEQRQLIGYVWNKLFRTALIHEHHLRFDAEIPIGEDGVFAMTVLSHATSLATTSNAAYYYVFNGKKTFSFSSFNRRLDSFYNLLCSMKSMPSEVRNAFLFKEFRFSLYVLHVLYQEHLSTAERLSFLQKIRSRVRPCKRLSILSLDSPYRWIALIVVCLPASIDDFLFTRYWHD